MKRQYEEQPEIWEPYGQRGRAHSLQDAAWNLSYLAESLLAGEPGLFASYCAWLKVLFTGLGFPEQAMADTLAWTREALSEGLPTGGVPVAIEYLEAGLNWAQDVPPELPSFLRADAPLAKLARQYLDALLRGERHAASRLVLEAVEGGTSVKDIYLYVFQPCQHEIGRLWQMNRIGVAQEHFCTAATQLIMSQLYPYIFATDRVGRRLVATCVGGELHEIGVRMVADFFEMAGWDTYYLGANSPQESILSAVEERGADVLGISATMTFHVGAVRELIEATKSAGLGENGGVRILVGGYPFNIAPRLWQQVGADGHGQDAQQALAIANRLVGGEGGA